MEAEQNKLIVELYGYYFSKLVAYAAAELGNDSRAQDLVQDTFHDAVLHIDELAAHKNPGGWLMQTVKNKISTARRAQMRYLRLFLSMDSDVSAELAPSTDPTDSLLSEEAVRQSLTQEETRLVQRVMIDGASHLEVAQELGISLWACQKRVARVKRKLQKALT